jgi:hypothetical protein
MSGPESVFQRWVTDLFASYGWDVKHAPVPMRAIGNGRFVPDKRGAGLPDLTLTHDDPPRLILAECKAAGGVVSDEQRDLLRRLRAVADVVREAFGSEPSPLGVYVFAPGNEALIEALARGGRA